MFKLALCAMALLLLTGSAAFGSIFQGQSWGVGVDNAIHLQHSQQSGSSSQDVLINLSQNTNGGTGLVAAQASVFSTSHQIGGGLFGISSLAAHAQLIGIGGTHLPLTLHPMGAMTAIQGLVVTMP